MKGYKINLANVILMAKLLIVIYNSFINNNYYFSLNLY